MTELGRPEWDQGTYYCFLSSNFLPKYTTFHGKGFSGEGSKGGANGSPEFQRPNSWYHMVLRTFPPTRDGDQKTNVGWWIKDVEKNKWYTHGILQIPQVAKGFSGCGGFVEPLAQGDVRRQFERRLGYGRLDGKWHDAPVSVNSSQFFSLIENDAVAR